MAKYKPGPLAGQLSGKLGNVVFRRGRYGSVISTRSMPTLVQSDYTTDVRGRLAILSQQWGALTDEQKEAWKTWAQTHQVTDRLGDQITLQGNAAYIQLNANILKAGGTAIDVPPVVGPPLGLVTATLTCAAGTPTASLAYTATPLGTGLKLQIWAAVVDSPGRAYYRNMLKLVKVSAAAAASPVTFETELAARFGTLIEGQLVHVEACVVDPATGLVSGRIYAKDLVAA